MKSTMKAILFKMKKVRARRARIRRERCMRKEESSRDPTPRKTLRLEGLERRILEGRGLGVLISYEEL